MTWAANNMNQTMRIDESCHIWFSDIHMETEMKLSGVQQFCYVLQIVYNTSNPSYGVGSFSSTNVTILEDHRCFLTAAGN